MRWFVKVSNHVGVTFVFFSLILFILFLSFRFLEQMPDKI